MEPEELAKHLLHTQAAIYYFYKMIDQIVEYNPPEHANILREKIDRVLVGFKNDQIDEYLEQFKHMGYCSNQLSSMLENLWYDQIQLPHLPTYAKSIIREFTVPQLSGTHEDLKSKIRWMDIDYHYVLHNDLKKCEWTISVGSILYNYDPIPPIPVRPFVRMEFTGDSTLETDLTRKLADIIKANNENSDP